MEDQQALFQKAYNYHCFLFLTISIAGTILLFMNAGELNIDSCITAQENDSETPYNVDENCVINSVNSQVNPYTALALPSGFSGAFSMQDTIKKVMKLIVLSYILLKSF